MKALKQNTFDYGHYISYCFIYFYIIHLAQYAKHYEQKSDSSNAHTLNSSSAIIEQHTMSRFSVSDLYAPVNNITSSRYSSHLFHDKD